MTRPRALVLFGGWAGHHPEQDAEFAASELLDGFEVTLSEDLAVLNTAVLDGFDLLLPIWTFGEITQTQEASLLDSVARGLGVLAWHGATSAFLASRPHKFLLGGQFVAHPGGDSTRYTVRFRADHPLTEGLREFEVVSEQYYMLMDPSVEVLATTRMVAPAMKWIEGIEMPVAWTRRWGAGRVFYCSLGHTIDLLRQPEVTTLLQRAARCASREREDGPR